MCPHGVARFRRAPSPHLLPVPGPLPPIGGTDASLLAVARSLAANGVVWSGVHLATGLRCAVKIISPKDGDREAMYWIHREIEVMRPVGVKHAHIRLLFARV